MPIVHQKGNWIALINSIKPNEAIRITLESTDNAASIRNMINHAGKKIGKPVAMRQRDGELWVSLR